MATENAVLAPTSYPSPGQLWQVPLFLAGLLALGAAWATRPLWYDPEARQFEREMATARHLLEDPVASVNGVPALLVDALNRINRFPKHAGEAHFLLGSAYLRLAGSLPSERATDLWQKARLHLEQADTLGVADSDRTTLNYRLAKSWFMTGGDLLHIIPYLWQSIDLAAEDRGEGYDMLTQAYLRLPVPDLRGALLANERHLQLPADDESLLAPVRLLRGELLLGLKERDAARKVLARIGPGAPSAVLARARQLRARSYQDEEAWSEAAAIWEAILADGREKPAEPGRLRYYLGWCYRNLHRPMEAARVWEQTLPYGGEEAQAASLRLAELYLETGKREAAVPLFERALGSVAKAEDYHNTLVDLPHARSVLEASCRGFLAAADFDNAQSLARLHARLALPEPAQALVGRVAEARGKARQEQAKQLKDAEAVRRAEEAARTTFREAGTAFEAAAEASADPAAKLQRLWSASQNYLQGQDYGRAVAVLERYLTLRPPLERQGEAWYRLGEAHQALNNTAVAVVSFQRCLGYPGPFAYRARYQLAMGELTQGNTRDAEDALMHNLELMGVEPDREAHEKTLYALANLLFLRGEYRIAAQRWEQALTLYPTNAGAFSARYRLGDCYRHLADIELKNTSPNEPLWQVGRAHSYRQYNQWLEKSAAQYQKLADDLEARQAAAPLPEAEAALLRQSLFALAADRFDLGSYDEAIRLYNNLAHRYQHQVEGLWAVKQLWFCYIVPNPPDTEKAQATLQRAHILLNNLEDTAFQGRPEMESRAAWDRWLKEADEQLRKLSP
jgi:tetratricopeptide (TPR) repeat protein